MKILCERTAKAIGLLGAILCVLAVIGRFKGPASVLGNFQAINVYITGVGMMVFAIMHALICPCKKG